ncbi:MAG TPA: type I phosphomannose isomerase catalytic subunit [Erysipelotrichaceae bacterium]|nr:type I phosphomannose isomerase catalytic subunit [Erysipelotrichaceae bacterium]
MSDLLFFKPIGRFALWGVNLVKNYFQYNEFPDGIGQFWSFSTQDNASNICLNGVYKGCTLKQIWEENPDLFRSKYHGFPFIISLVGAEDNLSIQVHPNDQIAQSLGYEMGKNEAWYFLDSKPGSTIYYGHTYKNKKEMLEAVYTDHFDEKLLKKKVLKDSFVYLPAGLVHAMGKGNVVYEIQQSTDVTYRLYDFNRKDSEGHSRPLHLDEGLECIDFNQNDLDKEVAPLVQWLDTSKLTQYVCDPSFIIYKFDVNERLNYSIDRYLVCTVTSGEGKVNNVRIKLGDSFLVPCTIKEIKLEGTMTIMATSEA